MLATGHTPCTKDVRIVQVSSDCPMNFILLESILITKQCSVLQVNTGIHICIYEMHRPKATTWVVHLILIGFVHSCPSCCRRFIKLGSPFVRCGSLYFKQVQLLAFLSSLSVSCLAFFVLRQCSLCLQLELKFVKISTHIVSPVKE